MTFNVSVPAGSGSFTAKARAIVENFNGEKQQTLQVTITEP